MADSLEYRTVLRCLDQLVLGFQLNLSSIAIDLAAKGLVPPMEVTDKRNDSERARDLAGKVLLSVSLNRSRYNDLLSVLSKQLCLQDVVKTLKDHYGKLSPTCLIILQIHTELAHLLSSGLGTLNGFVARRLRPLGSRCHKLWIHKLY